MESLEVTGVSTLLAYPLTELHLIEILELFDLAVITDFLLSGIETGLKQLGRQPILSAFLANVPE